MSNKKPWRSASRPGQRQQAVTLWEAELEAAARRLLAAGVTGRLLRITASELGASAQNKADQIAAIMDAGSHPAMSFGCLPRAWLDADDDVEDGQAAV